MRTALLCVVAALVLSACALKDLSGERQLVARGDGGEVKTTGLDPVEREGGSAWRWGLGPATTLTFNLPDDMRVEVSVDMRSPAGANSVAVEAGKRLLDTIHFTGPGQWAGKWTVNCKKGENTITFRYQKWNGQGAVYLVDDNRPLAVAFYRLTVRPMALAGGHMAVAGFDLVPGP